MVLAVDTSRALRTSEELTQLIRAIYESDAAVDDEAHWVEWKGSLPLDKAAGQFPIAKAIIGFANRDPERAQTACEGVAYMVVGVKPGSVEGVTPVDGATFDQGIRKYVGGPRWDARYMKFEGADVLMLIVEAPNYGDPIHTLHKAYEKFDAGTIFHRGAAQSEPASPRDVAMLGERLVKGTRSPDLKLELTAECEPLMRLSLDKAVVQEWLDAREEYVRANSGEKPEKPKSAKPASTTFGPLAWAAPNIGVDALVMDHLYAKPGDAQKFEQLVALHLDDCKRRMADIVVRAIVDSGENVVTLSVFNDTDDPVTEVAITAHVPKPGLRVYVSPPKAPSLPVIPKWPNPLDEMRERVFQDHLAKIAADDLGFGSMVASVTEHDAFFEISWRLGNVLARDSAELDVAIVVGPAAPEEIEVDLMARSTSHRSVARSSAKLVVSSDTWGPADWWRAVPVPRG